MTDIRCIAAVLFISLFALSVYTSPASEQEYTSPQIKDVSKETGWMEDTGSCSKFTLTRNGSGSMQMILQLPEDFGTYAEVFGCSSLSSGEWNVVDSWIPTYGSAELTWNDAVSTNMNSFFYIISDAMLDFDGDGYSDSREHYVSRTDPAVFDDADADGDGIHDFWEIKLFGNIWMQDGNDDSDGDGLLNNQELARLGDNTIRMYSDPSLYDTDGEGLDDFTELRMQTDPLSVDTDSDGYDDAFEVLGSPPTDPNNPDIVTPVLMLAGG
jgi:hypothetical protein